MAVYTQLSLDDLVALFARIPDAGIPRALEGIAAGSINTMYRVSTDKGDRWLRVNEGKTRIEVEYEAALLAHLETKLSGYETPKLLLDDQGQNLHELEVEGETRLICVFAPLTGVELSESDLEKTHLTQLGRALATAHLALRDFRGGRANPFGTRTLRAWLSETRDRFDDAAHAKMRAAFARIERERRPLPRGVIHGDLFLNNTKWRNGQLTVLFDWEMAGRDHLMLDLAVCINAWCYQGGYRFDLARAFVAGYASVRSLRITEQRGLFVEARLAALRFTLSRIRDFELERAASGGRDHLDYREYQERLDALEQMGRAPFYRALFGNA